MFNATIVLTAAEVVVQFGALAQPPEGNSVGIAGAVRGIGNLVADDFGRYENGSLDGTPALAPVDQTQPIIDQIEVAVAEMLAARVTAQKNLTDAVTAAIQAADLISYPPDAFVAAIMALTEALRASINDPGDQIKLLSVLAGFNPPPPTNSAPIGAAIALLWQQEAAICRRAALISLARASAEYLPLSSGDATSVRTNICALFDAEITMAADNGDSQSYAALRTLRTAVARDLSTRGSNLPALTTFTYQAPMPALVVAHDIYRDASRAREVVIRVDPPMSLFMPLQFQALSE